MYVTQLLRRNSVTFLISSFILDKRIHRGVVNFQKIWSLLLNIIRETPFMNSICETVDFSFWENTFMLLALQMLFNKSGRLWSSGPTSPTAHRNPSHQTCLQTFFQVGLDGTGWPLRFHCNLLSQWTISEGQVHNKRPDFSTTSGYPSLSFGIWCTVGPHIGFKLPFRPLTPLGKRRKKNSPAPTYLGFSPRSYPDHANLSWKLRFTTRTGLRGILDITISLRPENGGKQWNVALLIRKYPLLMRETQIK